MIRHSSSLFISLFFHLFLGLIVLYLYVNKPIKKEIPSPKQKIAIKLSAFTEKKTLVIPTPIKKTIQRKKKKKIIKKIKKPIVKKVKKRVLKKKLVKIKKTIAKKVVPLKKEKIEIKQEVVKKIEKTVIKKVQPIQQQKSKEEIEKEQKNNYIVNYIDNNLYKIRELIKDNLYYPRKARRKGVVGEVLVKFRLKTDGKIDNIKVISSNHKILSRSAIRTIEELSSQFPKPETEIVISLPIGYHLH